VVGSAAALAVGWAAGSEEGWAAGLAAGLVVTAAGLVAKVAVGPGTPAGRSLPNLWWPRRRGYSCRTRCLE